MAQSEQSASKAGVLSPLWGRREVVSWAEHRYVHAQGDYVFECADLKPNLKPGTLHTDVDVVFGDIAFQQLLLEGRPRDGMMMTVRKRVQDLTLT
ncbi:unnamed protein product [Fusarium graminearum]|uniref:Chromosome 4, complete genome n=1 Tax=Gibberella zeae (strain ATCC MYA-4620 / CBS 123657 / FGSC 9075 / NRRL 31084 / PH-1) TaxID=229533 RepID=A0A098DVX1_GIBZE|nr:unnamed protein product [Fusarium graminearum]